MRAWLRSFSLLAAVCLAWCVIGGTVSAQQARQRGRSIEFSDPKTPDLVTNLHQLRPKSDGLRQLEEDLTKPFQTFSPQNSLQGEPAPFLNYRAPAVVPSKRTQELIEKRRNMKENWVWMNPDEMAAEPTIEEMFGLPEYDKDGQVKKKKTPMEKYYQGLDRDRGATNSATYRSSDRFGWDGMDPEDSRNSDGPSSLTGVRESEHTLRKAVDAILNGNIFAPENAKGNFTDIFGLGNTAPEQPDAMKSHFKEYESFYNRVSPVVPPADSLGGINPAANAFAPTTPTLIPSFAPPAPVLPTPIQFHPVEVTLPPAVEIKNEPLKVPLPLSPLDIKHRPL